MRVMVVIKANKASEAGEMPSEELLAAMGNFNQELVDAGILLAGDGLHPSSKGVRVKFSGAERIVTDGPFAETKELIAGFWIWKVDSMQEAIDWIKRCPCPADAEDGEVEIRPIFEADDFGDEFTPELREQEASIRAKSVGLSAPRFEEFPETAVVGVNETYGFEDKSAIPDQWSRFAAHLATLGAQAPTPAFGVCRNAPTDCRFDYLTCVPVNGQGVPENFSRDVLPAGRYVVFTHEGRVSALPDTIDRIWSKWAPECGLKLDSELCFERYDERFDPRIGTGVVEVWIPLMPSRET